MRKWCTVTDRKPFLLRIDSEVLDSLQRWAGDDLRSLNAQIEFLLRRVLLEHKRLKEPGETQAKRERKRDDT
jgi:hypothetical protein